MKKYFSIVLLILPLMMNAQQNGFATSKASQSQYDFVIMGIDQACTVTLNYPEETATASNALVIKSNVPDFFDLWYLIFDENGQLITRKQITGRQTTILMEGLELESYILQIANCDKIVKTYRIMRRPAI